MDPTRQRVLDTLLDADGPMTVAELAAVIGVHRTAIGQHLRHLVAEGAVAGVPLAPRGRGRPSTGYFAVDPAPYRTLAAWLASAATRGLSPRDAGREVGRRLAPVPDTGDDTVTAIEREATRLGFRPVRHDRGDEIELRLDRCPYADIASADLGVVCQLHLGVVEGMAALEGQVVVDDLRVADPHRGGCRIHLHRLSG